jgi:hypothetical protein
MKKATQHKKMSNFKTKKLTIIILILTTVLTIVSADNRLRASDKEKTRPTRDREGIKRQAESIPGHSSLNTQECNTTDCIGIPERRELLSECDVARASCTTYAATSPTRVGGQGWVLTARCPATRSFCGKTQALYYAGGGCRAIDSASTTATGNLDPKYSKCSTLALVSSHPVRESPDNFEGRGMGHRCLWHSPGSSCSVKYASVVNCCTYFTQE